MTEKLNVKKIVGIAVMVIGALLGLFVRLWVGGAVVFIGVVIYKTVERRADMLADEI